MPGGRAGEERESVGRWLWGWSSEAGSGLEGAGFLQSHRVGVSPVLSPRTPEHTSLWGLHPAQAP